MKVGLPRINGKPVSRRKFLEHRGVLSSEGVPAVASAYGEEKPLVSIGAGCHPRQVKAFNEALQRRGIVGARYRPDGAVEFTSRGARKRTLKALGLHDNQGGYGD